MSKFQELMVEVLKVFLEDDQDTFNLLLQNEQDPVIMEVEKNLSKTGLKQRTQNFMANLKSLKLEKEMRAQNDEKIRLIKGEIDRQLSESSEEDVIEKEMTKKKQLKLEEKPGYSFYGNIKCLMKAYGDLAPSEESIKTMHSQVTILFEIFFRFVSGLEQMDLNNSSVRKAVQIIFKEQCEAFDKITKEYKKATKSTKKKQEIYESSSEEDEFITEEKDEDRLDHMDQNTLEESQYLASITKSMDNNEYQSYSECRSVNFLSNNHSKKNNSQLMKFSKFLDPQNKFLKPTPSLMELLSFICCRLIRKILFEVIRYRSQGKLKILKDHVTASQIKIIGNKLIQDYESKLNKLRISQNIVDSNPKRLFIQDFNNESFKIILPKFYRDSNKTVEQIWQNSSHYRKMWTKRSEGEKEIQNFLFQEIDEQQFQPRTEYAKFILKNLNLYRKRGSAYVWEIYFSQNKVNQTEGIGSDQKQIIKGKKKVKLESLKRNQKSANKN